MSEENIQAFERATEATNRRDVEAVLAEADSAVEFHAVVPEVTGGKGMVYRGHDGIRQFFRDLYEALMEVHFEYAEIRDSAIEPSPSAASESGANGVEPRSNRPSAPWSTGEAARRLAF